MLCHGEGVSDPFAGEKRKFCILNVMPTSGTHTVPRGVACSERMGFIDIPCLLSDATRNALWTPDFDRDSQSWPC